MNNNLCTYPKMLVVGWHISTMHGHTHMKFSVARLKYKYQRLVIDIFQKSINPNFTVEKNRECQRKLTLNMF
jgi:hypothetical protein